jgi:hypothetical protein
MVAGVGKTGAEQEWRIIVRQKLRKTRTVHAPLVAGKLAGKVGQSLAKFKTLSSVKGSTAF